MVVQNQQMADPFQKKLKQTSNLNVSNTLLNLSIELGNNNLQQYNNNYFT